MTEVVIPRTVSERLLKRGGAERVSADAKEALGQALERVAHRYAQEAVKIARMEGRTTVRATDIERAAQQTQQP